MVLIISEPMMLDQGPTSLYQQLKDIIKSRILSDEVVEYLCIKLKIPLLIIEGDYDARDGSPMFATIPYFRPDLYKYRIELRRT